MVIRLFSWICADISLPLPVTFNHTTLFLSRTYKESMPFGGDIYSAASGCCIHKKYFLILDEMLQLVWCFNILFSHFAGFLKTFNRAAGWADTGAPTIRISIQHCVGVCSSPSLRHRYSHCRWYFLVPIFLAGMVLMTSMPCSRFYISPK